MNTQTVTLDVTKRRQVMPEIRIGQGDENGTTLVANIYDNGEPFDLTSYSVRFAMKLPFDMAYWSVGGTVDGNTATFAIDESYAASVAGVTETAYVEVLSGSTVICSTNRIRVVCLESAYENVDPAHLWDNGVEQFLEDAQDTLDAAVAQAQSDVSDAVDDADAATTRATEAAEAAEGIILDALPTMTADIKGGAKLGSGLEIDDETLNVALVKSGTGRSVTSGGGALEALTVYGESVQDGTPTPDAPVDVQVVEGVNMLPKIINSSTTINGVTFTLNSDGTITANGTATAAAQVIGARFFLPEGNYFLSGRTSGYTSSTVFMRLLEYTAQSGGSLITSFTDTGSGVAVSSPVGGCWAAVFINVANGTTVANALFKPQLEKGSTVTPYTPYGSIGLKVGDTVTPIDLQGNVLASLPDGTKDVLTVDSAGHVVIDKAVKMVDLSTQTWTYQSTWGSWYTPYFTDMRLVSSVQTQQYYLLCSTTGGVAAVNIMDSSSIAHGVAFTYTGETGSRLVYRNGSTTEPPTGTFYYPLETSETIDLCYIDMPEIPDGAEISITAQVTPTIAASWWERGAERIASAIKSVMERIAALESAIAELATS